MLDIEDGNQQTVQENASQSHAAVQKLLGVFFALVVGAFGGSVLVPMSFVPKRLNGIAFLPSFGVGAGVMSLLVTCVYAACQKLKNGEWPKLYLSETLLPGLLSGLLWNLGNVCQIYAQSYAGLSYGISYPIMQCALFVSGLLGIFVFNELSGNAVNVFFMSGFVLLGGAAILGVYGPQ